MFRFWTRKRKNTPETEIRRRSSLPKGFTLEQAARKAILNGSAPEGLWTGQLKFEREANLRSLPRGLTASHLSISHCPEFESLPENLWAGAVAVRDCPRFGRIPKSAAFEQLEIEGRCGRIEFENGASLGSLRFVGFSGRLNFPEHLSLKDLVLAESPLQEFPDGVRVAGTLDLSGAQELNRLPDKMKLKALILRRCPSLKKLPDQLEAELLDISGCARLQWQEVALIEVTDLILADCSQVFSLPWWLIVNGSIDIANAGLTCLPENLRKCQLRWRGVPINERIAFHPKQIQVEEIFQQRNTEIRRVMLERVGWERFLQEANPQIRDRDYDPGGERRLLHMQFPDRETLVILSMSCPSTGRRYFIRVPPDTKSCHQAAAWIAGFDDPKQYEPISET